MNRRGLRINRPLAINCLLLAMGLFGTLSVFLGQFAYPNTGFIILMAFIFSGIFIVITSIAKGNGLLYALLAMFGAWLALGVLFRETLRYGMAIAARYIIPNLFKIMSYDFGDTPAIMADDEAACTAFILFILLPYTASLVWAVVVKRSGLFSLLITGIPCAAALMLRPLPPAPLLVILLVFWITVVMRPRLFQLDPRAEALVSSLAMGFSAIFLSVLFLAFPKDGYKEWSTAFSIRDGIIDMAVNFEYTEWFGDLYGYISGAPLTNSDGNVNLNAMGKIRFADKDILRVYSSQPETMYLRGYAASEYTGNQWLQADESDFDSAGINMQPMLYMQEMNEPEFRGNVKDIRVELLGRRSNYVFAPYLLTDIALATEDADWYGDSHLSPGDDREYAAQSYMAPVPNLIISSYVEPMGISYINNEMTFGSFDFEGNTIQYSYDTGSIGIDGDVDLTTEDWERLVNEALNSDIVEYSQENRDAEYMEYIQREYTQLPDGLQETLLEWRSHIYDDGKYADEYRQRLTDTNKSETPFWQWAQVAGMVAEEIRNSGMYTASPGPQPVNRDFVEYFLTERNEGYCVHYASATVAMLRALGIPARYVEGYVVGKSSFSNGWANVPAKNAHSWAEIWVPNLGWIPVESTPGGAPVEQSVIEQEEEELPWESEETETPEASPTPVQSTPTPAPATAALPSPSATAQGGDSGDGENEGQGSLSPLGIGLVLVAALALLALALMVNRQLRIVGRERRFNASEANEAALNIYAGIKAMEARGGRVSSRADAIAGKARFSQHTVDDEELDLLAGEYEKIRREVYLTSSQWQKLLMWLELQ